MKKTTKKIVLKAAPKFSACLPNGSTTNSFEHWHAEWQKGMPIMQKVYNLWCNGYGEGVNPCYYFSYERHYGTPNITLPVKVVQKMVETAQCQINYMQVYDAGVESFKTIKKLVDKYK